MQQTPVVSLPKEKRGRDWYPIIGALSLVLIVIFLAILVANPPVQAPPVVDLRANPELIVFEQYQAAHAAAIETARWHNNPELGTFHNFQALQSGGVSLSENPEVGAFLRWREGQ